ncbi:MAG: hypothetical protein V2A73_00685 [Pseudomonadota bacterium]
MRILLGSPAVVSALLIFSASEVKADRILYQQSSWDPEHTTIFTDFLVETVNGEQEVRRVPGGVVDGIGMVQLELRALPQFDSPTGPTILGFTRAISEGGAGLRWEKSCVYVTPDAAGTEHLQGDTEFQVIYQILDEWQGRSRYCSYLELIPEAPALMETKYDGRNVIKFRDQRWCRPASGDTEEVCHGSEVAGLTTIFYRDRPGADDDGTILDADIEINGVNFAVSWNGETEKDGPLSDLANTLTHEVGHLVGLDHTCWNGSGSQPRDHNGDLVPRCYPESALPDEVTEATMYNYQSSGETKKATLSQDDIDGYCAIYPLASDPGVCGYATKQDNGLCTVSCGLRSRRLPVGSMSLLLAVFALVARKRVARQ